MRNNPNPAPPRAATPVQPTSIIGRTFGALTVRKFVCLRSKRAYFLCGCNCGKTRVASSLKLKGGVVRACRDCARAPHQEEARRISGLTAAEIIAKWQDHYNAFTPNQRRAYFRLIGERRAAGLVVNDLARAAAVATVLKTWAERTLDFAGREARS